jgi:acetyltransferase-like isoleucine patch superfamily enzyme
MSVEDGPSPEDWEIWNQRDRWYNRNEDPVNKQAIVEELARRRAYARFPLHGEVLEGLRSDALEIGEHTILEPHVWLTLDVEKARIRIGSGCFLNIGVMVASVGSVEIGDHTMFANGCWIGDADHRFDDPTRPITWQGFTSKGPVSIGSNCWFGVNAVVTSGVTIGDRCVIGSNSVVTHDIPSGTIAAGAPARVVKEIQFKTT